MRGKLSMNQSMERWFPSLHREEMILRFEASFSIAGPAGEGRLIYSRKHVIQVPEGNVFIFTNMRHFPPEKAAIAVCPLRPRLPVDHLPRR